VFGSSVSYTVESAFYRSLPISVRRYITEQITNRLREASRQNPEIRPEQQFVLNHLPDILLSGQERFEHEQ